mmetsp:Transcript_14703/g.37232  ORF Transcript_14703/g.37232 Transcript_14703/m.37232 type:complete len:128 (+) Transcript_14703:1201-1584(+)
MQPETKNGVPSWLSNPWLPSPKASKGNGKNNKSCMDYGNFDGSYPGFAPLRNEAPPKKGPAKKKKSSTSKSKQEGEALLRLFDRWSMDLLACFLIGFVCLCSLREWQEEGPKHARCRRDREQVGPGR